MNRGIPLLGELLNQAWGETGAEMGKATPVGVMLSGRM